MVDFSKDLNELVIRQRSGEIEKFAIEVNSSSTIVTVWKRGKVETFEEHMGDVKRINTDQGEVLSYLEPIYNAINVAHLYLCAMDTFVAK